MSQSLVTIDIDNSIAEIERTQKMCSLLLKTKHYAKAGEEGIFAMVTVAKSIGLDPIEALNGGLYYVNGKVGMGAETMSRLVRQAGHSISKDPKSDENVCILNGKRADTKDTWTVSFSAADAKRAGLWKNMYEKYPATMLYNRAMSLLARQLFADVIKGCGYTKDELEEIAASKESDHSKEKSRNLQEVDQKTFEARCEDVTPLQNEVDSKPQEKVISSEQAQELITILGDCDEEYYKKVKDGLKKSKDIDSITQLPVMFYEALKASAIRNRDEYQSNLLKVAQ